MESPIHSLPALFKQLGLSDKAVDIDKFISTHSPLKPDLHLADAFSGAKASSNCCAKKSSRMRTGRR